MVDALSGDTVDKMQYSGFDELNGRRMGGGEWISNRYSCRLELLHSSFR